MSRAIKLLSPSQLKSLAPRATVVLDASWHSASSSGPRGAPSRVGLARRGLNELDLLLPLCLAGTVPGSPLIGKEEYLKSRVPLARFWDVDEIAASSPLCMPLP